MRKPPFLIRLTLLISVSMPATAQQSAHIHGFAEINLAIDGGELQIEFISPADSIVGFEYAPLTGIEHQAVTDAITLLRDPDRLFDIPTSAGCKLHEVHARRHTEGDHDDHDDHADEHAHEGHDDHAGHDDHDEATHSEFHAHYHFDCEHPSIEAIGLRLFDTWPTIESVRVQALTPGGQTGGKLDANDPVIRLQ